MKAKDIMTPDVIWVRPEAPVLEAARLMLSSDISGLPVVDGKGRLVGMLTEGDFLHRAEIKTERRRPRWLEILLGPGRMAEDYVHSHGRKVEEIMSQNPQCVTEDAPLDDVVRLMERHRIKRIPVVRDGEVVGIISRANLMRALVAVGEALPQPSTDDRAIRARILDGMKANAWAPTALVTVTVSGGVVDLWGTILDERHRGALTVLAENVAGVKRVRDHLVWVEPYSGAAFGPEPDGDKKNARAS